MALQMSVTSDYGPTYPSAYVRINGLSWQRDSGQVQVSVAVFVNATAATGEKRTIITAGYIAPVAAFANAATDWIAVAYAWLKQRVPLAGELDFRQAADV